MALERVFYDEKMLGTKPPGVLAHFVVEEVRDNAVENALNQDGTHGFPKVKPDFSTIGVVLDIHLPITN